MTSAPNAQRSAVRYQERQPADENEPAGLGRGAAQRDHAPERAKRQPREPEPGDQQRGERDAEEAVVTDAVEHRVRALPTQLTNVASPTWPTVLGWSSR